MINIHTLGLELTTAYAERRPLSTPPSRDGLDLSTAYAVERELASAMTKQNGAQPLGAGDLVSSGTLTESTPIQPGATWTASVEGIDLPTLTLTLAR